MTDEENEEPTSQTPDEMAVLAATMKVFEEAVEQMQASRFDVLADQVMQVLKAFRDSAKAAGFSDEFAEKIAMEWAQRNLMENEITLTVRYEHAVDVEDDGEEN